MTEPALRRIDEGVHGNQDTAPDPGRLAGLLVRAWLEVRCGHRPVVQLGPYVTPTVLARLRHQTARERPRPVPSVRRVTARRPAPGVCEAVVTVTWASGRVTSIAARLEQHHGRWRAVEITPPESGFHAVTSTASPAASHAYDIPNEAPAYPAAAAGVLTHRGSA